MHVRRGSWLGWWVVALAGMWGCQGCKKTETPPPPPPAANADEERGRIIQALLDSAWIQNAIEPEGGSPPLVVVTSQPLAALPLHAFGQPVRVLSPKDAQAQRPESYLEIAALRLEGDQAQVTFRDEARGVSGEARLAREKGVWKVTQVTGSER